MNPLNCCEDHAGKLSQSRIAALGGAAAACALATAPLWGGPDPSMELVLVLFVGPGGLALWQKLRGARGEVKTEPAADA